MSSSPGAAFHRVAVVVAVCVVLSGCAAQRTNSGERQSTHARSSLGLRRIAALGDSNTQAWAPVVIPDFPFGWGVDRDEQYLVRLIERLNSGGHIAYRDIEPWEVADSRSPATDRVLLSTPYVAYNMGVAGAESEDVLALQNRNPLVDQSDTLIIAVGTNDLIQGVPTGDVVTNVGKVVERALGTGAIVLVCGVPPAAPEYFASRDADDLNRELRALADEKGVVFVDLDAVLDVDGDSVNDCPLGESDYLHFSAEGHQRIADAFPTYAFQR